MSFCPEEFRKHTNTAVATFFDATMSIQFFIGDQNWYSWGRITFCSGETTYELFVDKDTYLRVDKDVFAAFINSKEKAK